MTSSWVSDTSLFARAMPKSLILTVPRDLPRSAIRMLPGLMSRWTMPAACASVSAAAICAPICATSSGGNVSARFIAWARLRAGKYSMTNHGSPDSIATSYMAMEWGWVSFAAFLPSRNVRSRTSSAVSVSRPFRACDLFHRDVTAEEGVAGQPDGAHASVADLGAESVPPRQQVFGPDAPPGLLLSCHISRLMD